MAKTVFILDCWLFVSNISWPGKQGKVSWAGQLQGRRDQNWAKTDKSSLLVPVIALTIVL